MEFLNEKHKKRYMEALGKSGISEYDRERQALFYILTGNVELYKYLDNIYDFKRNKINRTVVEELGYLSSGVLKLMHLGLHLFNDANPLYGSLVTTLCGLDGNNRKLAMNAMEIRALP